MDPLSIRYTSQQIDEKRSLVSKLFMDKSANIKTPDISSISPKDLELLLDIYDQVFFDFWFKDSFKGSFSFSLSRRMTRSAGMTVCPKNIMNMKPESVTIDIKISLDMILSYGTLKDSAKVGGILTKSSLEALQLVMEHEICHAIEFISFGRSSCKMLRFKKMAENIFGHTESSHSLPTPGRLAYEDLGIKIGSTVGFVVEGKNLTGIVSNINKRATVMVRDKNGGWKDSAGRRYAKYYVPLEGLTRK